MSKIDTTNNYTDETIIEIGEYCYKKAIYYYYDADNEFPHYNESEKYMRIAASCGHDKAIQIVNEYNRINK